MIAKIEIYKLSMVHYYSKQAYFCTKRFFYYIHYQGYSFFVTTVCNILIPFITK